jgi:hypothetical protein
MIRWDSPDAVAKIHSFFENLESLSLLVAITLELYIDFAAEPGTRSTLWIKRISDVAWAVLVIADLSSRVYGWRDKKLSEIDKQALLDRLADTNNAVSKIRLQQAPRWVNFNHREFIGLLQERPKGIAEIWYQRDDGEGFFFANNLQSWLVMAGWTVHGLNQIDPTESGKMPAILELGGQPKGITVMVPSVPYAGDELSSAMIDAFTNRGAATFGIVNETLPAGTVRIIIGPQ